jgi:hypothetical protein
MCRWVTWFVSAHDVILLLRNCLTYKGPEVSDGQLPATPNATETSTRTRENALYSL